MKKPKRFIKSLALIMFWSRMLRVISELPKFLSSTYVTEHNGRLISFAITFSQNPQEQFIYNKSLSTIKNSTGVGLQ